VGLQLLAVSFQVRDAPGVGRFWAGLLGRDVVTDDAGALVPRVGTQVGLRFVETKTEVETGPNRLHLHLTSTDLQDQVRTVGRAEELGGRVIHRYPEEGHVVMADPGGNEFCVIEPGNRFLEGAGFLAEATDHGPPGAGRFWSQALAWPLVWEQGLQTAIQHPSGGTKLSWDIRDQDRPYGSKQQWLHLVADDVDDERARLVGLGALRVEADEDALVMTDPGGNRFTLSPA
jgi:predicted enzyme related to lactoylglutathione lyase